jgi:hypothetical protein
MHLLIKRLEGRLVGASLCYARTYAAILYPSQEEQQLRKEMALIKKLKQRRITPAQFDEQVLISEEIVLFPSPPSSLIPPPRSPTSRSTSDSHPDVPG